MADAPGDAEQRIGLLAAWRDQLDAMYAGRATHPYAIRLARVVRGYGLSREHFDSLLDGLERDVRTYRMASYDELYAYCDAVAASLAYLCLEILGATSPAERRYGRDLAIGIQIANILRDIDEDAERGYIYLPMDELEAAGVAAEDILHKRMSPALASVCRRLAERARALITAARASLEPAAARRLLVPEIWADVYLALMDELDRVAFDVFGLSGRHKRPYLQRRRKLLLALRRWSAQLVQPWVGKLFPRRRGMW